MSTPPVQGQPLRVIVCGAAGRMGARLCALASDDPAFALVGAIERPSSSSLGQPAAPRGPRITDPAAFPRDSAANCVIDFSSDEGAAAALALAESTGAALLIGTTALSPATLALLRTASARRAVLVAPNTSAGVTALAGLVRLAAKVLGPGYECSIVEAHHSAKKDAPSGTALRLAQAARDGGARLPDDRIASIRGGDVIGEHTVRFAGPGEYIEITHRATSRDLFARGALNAAAWLSSQAPGWWTMNHVLGLPE